MAPGEIQRGGNARQQQALRGPMRSDQEEGLLGGERGKDDRLNRVEAVETRARE